LLLGKTALHCKLIFILLLLGKTALHCKLIFILLLLGKTALHWAAAVNNYTAAQVLLQHGANRDAQDHKVKFVVIVTMHTTCKYKGQVHLCREISIGQNGEF
jgi:hypothetical protein